MEKVVGFYSAAKTHAPAKHVPGFPRSIKHYDTFIDLTEKLTDLSIRSKVDGLVKSLQGRHSRERESPEVVDFPGFPCSLE